MNYEPILYAASIGLIWSGIMDKAFPRFFDQLPRPFGCSGCMAFWTGCAYSATITLLPVPMFTPETVAIPFVSLFTACLGYRTYRLL
jgi:hypothetical protein